MTLRLKTTTSFACKEKIRATVVKLYLDDTLNKEEVLMTFDELEVLNSLLHIFFFMN